MTVSCIVDASYDVHFSWYKDGRVLEEDEKLKLNSFTSMSTLMLHKSAITDAGNYTCVANSGSNQVSASAELRVASPPKFLVEPQNVKLHFNEYEIVNCIAVGFPSPKIGWHLKGEPGKILHSSQLKSHIYH